MCLIAMAIDQSQRFPLVIAANRDEYFVRPTARLGWWTPEGGGDAILGGRDLQAGGTWLGLTAAGRLAMVTNVRDPRRIDEQAPSRGAIVPRWLSGREPTDRFWSRTMLSGYNGFNLIAADFRRGECFWGSSLGASTQRLERGVFGVSNATLDASWPKTNRVKAGLAESMAEAKSLGELTTALFGVLSDRSLADDAELPSTGISLERERQLSSVFIRTPDNTYGTRSSTLIVSERVGREVVTHVLERSFSATGAAALLRHATLKRWPPRYTDAPDSLPVAESEVTEETGCDPADPVTPKRTRVRSLLKPVAPRR
jgi:uncharacterized protein with NRDE domain